MKIALIIALSLASAAPAVIIPTSSDAQVLAGQRRYARPALSERDVERLNSAQDRVLALEEQIAAIEAAGEAGGGLTPAQTAQIEERRADMARAQETVDKLEAKRARRQEG